MLSELAQRFRAFFGGAGLGTLDASPASRGQAFVRRQGGTPSPPHRADAPVTVLSEARARCLLRRVLDTDQRRQYDAYGCFAVQVADRGAFGVLQRPFFNVIELRTGYLHCCVLEEKVPLADLMLAQKLLLECDPDSFFSIANATDKPCSSYDRLRALLAGWQPGCSQSRDTA